MHFQTRAKSAIHFDYKILQGVSYFFPTDCIGSVKTNDLILVSSWFLEGAFYQFFFASARPSLGAGGKHCAIMQLET